MRESRRTNLIILASVLMIAAAFAAYTTMLLRWLAVSKAAAPGAPAAASKASLESSLESARRDFRERPLDPRAHLRLSEALWKIGRPVDSFYVLYAARRFFPDDAFRRAHAEIILGRGGPASAALARLRGLRDPALTVPIRAEVARDYPGTPEGRESLDQLSRLAMAAGGEGDDAARVARIALDELYRADPKNPERLAALAGADVGRGDAAHARALAADAWSKYFGHAGAARVLGMLALEDRDVDGAVKWLTAAWDRDSDDLYSAAKLAQIYQKDRADAEGALPFYLALYRQAPDYDDGIPAEKRIREILDRRGAGLLKDAPVDGLGFRFKLDDASLRAAAAQRAADFKDPRWIAALGELLDDDAEIVRLDAERALLQIASRDPAAVRAAIPGWLAGGKPLARVRAQNLAAELDRLPGGRAAAAP